MKSIRDKFIKKVFTGYLELVYRTSKVEFDREELQGETLNNCIIGFWHGNSYVMNLLLKYVMKDHINPRIIVTADKRGDYIEEIIKKYGGSTLRMPDGVKMKKFLKELKEESKRKSSTLCVALDGPLGPIYEAKKLGFMLANEGEKHLIGIKINLSRKFTIKKRWDNYAIPLPFTKIEFKAYNFGEIDKKSLANFKENKKGIQDKLKVD